MPDAALGAPLSLLFFGGGEGWPPTPAPLPLHSLRRCAVESLLVSGEFDVSTPPQTARDEALPFLPHGTQVIVPRASHVEDMWQLQPEAMHHLVATFLDRGAIDARFDAVPPPLSPAVRLPVVAKALPAGAGAVSFTAVGACLRAALVRRPTR